MKNRIKNYDLKDYHNTIPKRYRIDIICQDKPFCRNAVYFDTILGMFQYARYKLRRNEGYMRFYDRKMKRFLYSLMNTYRENVRLHF
mgnify:CR=1 FL=1